MTRARVVVQALRMTVVGTGLVALSSCGGSSGERSSRVQIREQTAAGDLVALEPAPINDVSHPSVVAGPNHIAELGGFRVNSEGVPTAFSDTVGVFSTSDNRWATTSLPNGPMVKPGAIWNGSSLVVVGASCSEAPPQDDGDPYCKGASLDAVAYEGSSQKWTQVAAPLPPTTASSARPPLVRGIGMLGGGMLFAFDGDATSYELLDATTMSWRAVPSPPKGTSSVCSAGDRAYAIGLPDDNPIEGSTAPASVEAWQLLDDTATWKLAAEHQKVSVGQLFTRLDCGGNAIALVPIAEAGGSTRGVLWLDVASNRWEELPELPVSFPGSTVAAQGTSKLLFPATPVGGGLALDNSGKWADLKIHSTIATASAMSDSLLLSATSDESGTVQLFTLSADS